MSIYREGDNLIPIVLGATAHTCESLEGLTIATVAKNGTLIPLAQIAKLTPGFDFVRIRRKNQERTITARSASLAAGQLLDSIRPGLQALDLSGEYHIDIAGQVRKSVEINQRLIAGFPVGLGVMIHAIMASAARPEPMNQGIKIS